MTIAKIKFSQLPPAEDTIIEDDDIIPVVNLATSKTITFGEFKQYLTGSGFAFVSQIDSAVSEAIETIVGGAPEYLDTLEELADAINNDAGFAATVEELVNNVFVGKNTDDLIEGATNRYWTAARGEELFDLRLGAKNTNDLTEAWPNLYFTEQRVLDIVEPLITGDSFSGSYNDLTDKPTVIAIAPQWTANHTLLPGGVNTRYLIGDAVYDNGNIYVANFENESLPTTSTLYWTNIGPGKRLNLDGRDIPNITYAQLNGKPVIPTDINQLTDADGLLGGGGLTELPTDPEFESVTTAELNVETVNFTGTGAVTINSNNDLNLQASGWITFSSLPRLPNYTIAQLNALTGVPTGAFAFCTDLTQPAPVYYDGAVWRDMINNDINGGPDDFSAPTV